MVEENIIEGNKIIGEFMGNEDPLNYMYDTFWDWLMPVVEKIEQLHFSVRTWNGTKGTHFVNIGKTSLHKDIIVHIRETQKIEAVWLAVVEFIKWYNNNKWTQDI